MIVILTTLCATLFIQLGYFLWKLSAEHQPRIGQAPGRDVAMALISDWRWMLGLGSTIVGWILFVKATALGEISLVQPLMSAGDVLLVLMAVVFLKERMHSAEWQGLGLTVLGAAALSWHAQPRALLAPNLPHLLMVAAALVVLGALILYASRHASKREVPLALVVGLAFGLGAVLTEALTAQPEGGDGSLGWEIVLNPLLAGVAASNIAGLVLLQAAFQRGRASVIVPIQLALANAVTVIVGLTLFSEQVTALRAAGILLILAGAVQLHRQQR